MSPRTLRSSAPLAFACAALLWAGPALAQETTLEVTPFVGYDFGGNFEVFDVEFGAVDFEIQDSESFGVIVGFPIGRWFQIEAMAFRQPTTLEIDEGIFDPAFELSDLDIDYLQAGVVWQGAWGQVQPFVGGGMGLALLNPELPVLDSETRFAFNFGAGVKTFFTPHFGLRFEGRMFLVSLPEDDDLDLYCCYDYEEVLTQGHVSVGLIFAF